MKKTKNIFTMLATAAILFLLPYCSPLKVSADEPVTYAVKYLPSENDWRYQQDTSTFNEENASRELYYMSQTIKNGDIVVVYNPSSDSQELNLGSTHLSNLTVVESNGLAIIHTGGIDDCFVLAGCSAAINGNITNAYVYDYALCNFGGNVRELTIYAQEDVTSNIGCGGTVGHLYVPSTTLPRTFYDFYNFEANSLSIEDGILLTSDSQYGGTSNQSAPAPTAAPQKPSTSSSVNNSEYDSVPKTGEANVVPWLLCIAGLCIVGCFGLKYRKNQ